MDQNKILLTNQAFDETIETRFWTCRAHYEQQQVRKKAQNLNK